MTGVRHILLPTDYSELARRAAMWARSLAETYGATLHVVYVVERVPVVAPGPEVDSTSLAIPGPEARAAAEEAMDRFVEDCLADPAVPVIALVREGVPRREIAGYAVKEAIDLIVIGTHARGVVKRIFLGSTSKWVLEHAPCPVLMVPLAAAESAGAWSGSVVGSRGEATR